MAQPTHTKVAAAPAHAAATKSFLAVIGDIARREHMREGEAFVMWMEAAARAIAGSAFTAMFHVEQFERNEAAYMEIVKRRKHPKETMDDCARALAHVVEALEAEPGDFLSPIFGELAAYDKAGQFMTPFALSEVSARMLLGDAPAILEAARRDGRSWISLSEPAVGMGSMVLAATKVLHEHGIDVHRQAHWQCVDVDFKAVCGAYIQLSLAGVSAWVIHGNTLSLETWGAFPTPMCALFPKFKGSPPPEPEVKPSAYMSIFPPSSGLE